MVSGKRNRLSVGSSALLLSVPHAGTRIPESMAGRMNQLGQDQPDADHQVDRLYEWAPALDVTLIAATHSRYVVDLNRPPDDEPLYPGAGTGLVPVETFTGAPIYQEGMEPGRDEVQQRLQVFWRPYHQAIDKELHRIKSLHGYALLLDAHSIASRVPRLFDGRLPDLNLGSNQGLSCSADLLNHAHSVILESRYSHVVDGRFKGGYITRHYGRPEESVHALQLELSQACYLNEADGSWNSDRATALQEFLKQFVQCLLKWKPQSD